MALAVCVIVSAIFVYLLLAKLDLREVYHEMRRVDPGILALLLITTPLGFVAMAGRSALLLRPLAPFSFFTLFKSVLVGFAGNNVLPFRVGELLRVDYLARRGPCPHSACLAVLAVERLLDVSCLVLLFFGLATVVIDLPSTPALGVLTAMAAFALFTLAAVGRRPHLLTTLSRALTGWLGEALSGWITEKATRFAEGLASLGSGRRVLGALAFSWLYWLTMMLNIQVVLVAFDLYLPWHAPAVVLVFITFGALLPSTPAMIGTFHYFSSLALTLLGVEPAQAASFAIVQHAVGMVPFTLFSVALLMGDYLRGDLVLGGRSSEGP